MELNQLTEGAGTSRKDEQSRRSRRGERPPLVAMSHLAGPLFVALSIPDAEPDLLVHRAGEMHVPEEVQGRRVA